MTNSSFSGFVSGGRSFGAGVVSRVSQSGWVWSQRAARWVPGFMPTVAPASVCVPFSSFGLASRWAGRVAAAGFRVLVRRPKRCAAVFEVKVVLPMGLSLRAARRLLPSLPC